MKKSVKILGISLIGFVFFLLITLTLLTKISAADIVYSSSQSAEVDYDEDFLNSMRELFKSWEQGSDINAITIKYLFLALLILLIFSIFVSVNFPESGVLKFIFSVIISFLATWYITPREFWTILSSYSALAISLFLFVPILILIFGTIMTSKAGNPIGVFFTRILWLIYSFLLFIRGIITLILKTGIKKASAVKFTIGFSASDATTTQQVITYNQPIPKGGVIESILLGDGNVKVYAKPILKLVSNETVKSALYSDFSIAILLLIVSIFLFWIIFKKYSEIDRTVKEWLREANIEKLRDSVNAGLTTLKAVEDAGREITKTR